MCGLWGVPSTDNSVDLWGVPPTNMFATGENSLLPLCVSPVPDDRATDVDTLSCPWDNRGLVYAFPPPILIPRVLQICRGMRKTSCILIPPNNTNRPWYPEIVQMAKRGPLDLPLTDNLLTQRVHGKARRVKHLNPQALSLAAWLL